MSMNARPTPKQIVEDARKVGLLRGPMCSENGILGHTNEEIELRVRLPSEVGLQVIRPTPKPAPCKLLKRAKREAGNRKWIIPKKDRPELVK